MDKSEYISNFIRREIRLERTTQDIFIGVINVFGVVPEIAKELITNEQTKIAMEKEAAGTFPGVDETCKHCEAILTEQNQGRVSGYCDSCEKLGE